MQKQFDLFLFLFSNAVLIYWCILVFKHKREKSFLLRLNKKQVIVFIIIEVFLFVMMYLNYKIYKITNIADGFAWHYSIIYARGVLPMIALASINDRVFNFTDPIFSCLGIGLIVDYFILLSCSKIADAIKLDSKL